MKPHFLPRKLTKTKPSEYALRFVFGGLVATAAAFIGERRGPEIGGLFLAFPALLPASLTLVRQHDGRKAAYNDARGAIVGSLGLLAFAAVMWLLADEYSPAVVLGVAVATWVALSVALWRVVLSPRSQGDLF